MYMYKGAISTPCFRKKNLALIVHKAKGSRGRKNNKPLFQ